jgi:TRAP-type uncharacterized transport system fused permease subunit
VALAAYFASAIARANPIRISITAWRLALPGFIVPYLFVYNTGLLLQGPLWNILLSVALTGAGFGILISGLAGYFRGKVSGLGRVALIVSGGLLAFPLRLDFLYINVIGGLIFAAFLFKTGLLERAKGRKEKDALFRSSRVP